jgi:hypothetical protein
MVGVVPLGVAAQAEGDESATGTSGPAGEVTTITNLIYATGRSPDDASDRMLTAYLPAGTADVPMVIDAGWAVLDPWALAKQGVAVFLANTPDRWGEVVVDSDPEALRSMAETVACAVRFARGSEYGSETAPLVLTGFSRHGATASHVALANESFDQLWEEYADSMGGPPSQYDCTVAEASTRVDGLVGVAGPYDNVVGYDGSSYDSPFARDFLQEHEPELWEMLWGTVGLHPELRVRLLHGDADGTIPLESSAVFEAVLAEAGYDVELVEFEGGHTVPPDLVIETVMELIP